MSGVPRSGASPRNMNVPTEGNKGQSGLDAVKNTAWHLATWGLRAVVASTEDLSTLISGDLPPRPMRWCCGVRAARPGKGSEICRKRKSLPLELSWKRLWGWKLGRQACVDDPPTPADWKGNRKSDGLKHQHGQWRDVRPELDWLGNRQEGTPRVHVREWKLWMQLWMEAVREGPTELDPTGQPQPEAGNCSTSESRQRTGSTVRNPAVALSSEKKRNTRACDL